MNDYVIVTDNTCDLDESLCAQYGIDVVTLPYTIDDVVYGTDNNMSLKDFYNIMREGKMPTTMACNPESYTTAFKKHLDAGKDVLYIAFTSAMSSSCGNAMIVANELNEEYSDCKVTVVDSLSASMGEGLLVYKAAKMKAAGKSLEEIVTFIEDNKLNVCHFVTVDDLFHLHRGGRVSKTTAVVGSLINIKPVIHVNDEGKLISFAKARGRRKSLTTLVTYLEEYSKGYTGENDTVMISHGDCIEDVQIVIDEINKRMPGKEIIVSLASQTIGTHTGPGLVAIFFMGEHR